MPGADARLSQPAGRAAAVHADGFYITGDVFRRDADGFHYFVGRTDDMFVSGGENIYPADVERMLERHPDVAQAAVVPVDDEIKGQKPVAFVIRKAGRTLDERRGQAICARQRAGLSASALRLVRRRIAARLDQQGRPQRAAPDGAGADALQTGIKLRTHRALERAKTLSPRRGVDRLARPFAQIGDQALLAQRPARDADVAAVQDQPVVGVQLVCSGTTSISFSSTSSGVLPAPGRCGCRRGRCGCRPRWSARRTRC